MARLEYFLVAESCSQDINRNSLSVFHILNDVRLHEMPGVIHELVAVSGWVMSDEDIQNQEEFQLRIRFDMPVAEEGRDFRANLRASTRFQNHHFWLAEVPVGQSGDIVVRLFLDDVEKATHTIAVSHSD